MLIKKLRRANKAFTLAEVFIIMIILGLIAAMTIPTIVSHVEEKVTVMKLKKVYSVLTQAFERAKIDYGFVDGWAMKENTVMDKNTGEHVLEDTFWIKLIPYFKHIKYDSAENMSLVKEK